MNRSHRVQRVLCVCLSLAACGKSDSSSKQAPPAAHVSAAAPVSAAAAASRREIVFSEREGGVAQIVDLEGGWAQVLHNGKPGKPYAAVGDVVLSRDGRRCAHGAGVDRKWRMVVDGQDGPVFDAVGAAVFSPDGAHLAYPARAAGTWSLVVDGAAQGPTRSRYLSYGFSAGGTRIVFVDGAEGAPSGRLVVSDLAFKKQTVVEPVVNAVQLEEGGARLAAVVPAGTEQRLVTLDVTRPTDVRRFAPCDRVGTIAFGPGGSVAYVAERAGGKVVVLDGKEASITAGHPVGAPVIMPGAKGVGLLVASLSGSVLLRELFTEGPRAEPAYEEAEGLVYSADGRHHAYTARRGASWFLVLDGKEGPAFDRVVTPVFSADGRHIAYRARKDGNRFVVVADTSSGGVSLHPRHEQVFPVVFTADGQSIAYGVKDGARLAWQVEAR